ncbi:hypothetical protein CPB86DRAFT_750104 [Serendipita vermifera]|nr:hypothetical protein CPB86DRAFT_750104 [Serendipita vermifera]
MSTSTSRKRKFVEDDEEDYAEVVPAPASKKTRVSTASKKSPHTSAVTLMRRILADSQNFDVPADEEGTRAALIQLAEYAQSLETSQQSKGGAAAPKEKSEEEIKAEVDKLSRSEAEIKAEVAKLSRACVSQITKQMKWKDSCKSGTAKWSYDGICADPVVFGAMLGLKGPPNWKMKKIPKQGFEQCVGPIEASARYSELRITSNEVNVRWNPDTKEFKFSGSYGDPWRAKQ